MRRLLHSVGHFIASQIFIFGVPTVALACVAWPLSAWRPEHGWTLVHLVLALPLVYCAWLLVFVILSALEIWCHRRHAPLARRVYDTRTRAEWRTWGFIVLKYARMMLLESLPLTRVLTCMPAVRILVWRAYAPTVRIAPTACVYGIIYDPDLTCIDDGALVGGRACVSAHNLNVGEDDNTVFACAPVHIGKRATVGANARVGMGVTIGDDAIVEPASNLLPFTVVPAAEVWGGNPAVFRRRRLGLQPAAVPSALGEAPSADSGDRREEVRRLVTEALGLPAETAPDDLSAAACDHWDSLGQFSIAATLQQRFDIDLRPADIFSLRSLADVHALLQHGGRDGEGRRRAGPVPAEEAFVLPPDPELLPLLDHDRVTRALAQRLAAADATTPSPLTRTKVAVAATFTAEPLAPPLRLWCGAFGIDVQIEFAGYGQVAETLLSTDSLFAHNADGVDVVLVRVEDLWSPGGSAAASERLAELLAALRAFAENGVPGRSLLVGNLPPPVSGFVAVPPATAVALAAEWQAGLAAIPGVDIVDVAAAVTAVGTAAAGDPAMEAAARAPYSAAACREIAVALARALRRRHRPPAKVIAIDCDNTLWGGVVAEDGIDALALGPDGAGNAFYLLQQHLRRLRERGVLLALVSRNRPEDVWQVFDEHPGMVLRRDDIAASRIGWQPKSESLRQLAEELNVGLDSCVFVDDDPVQRLEVEANAPAATVVPLATEPARYCAQLRALWLFDTGLQTAEDAQRTELIRAEQQRREHRQADVGLDDYLRGLQLRVAVAPPAEHDLPRVAQLIQKTNQFNLSLKRRTLTEIRDLGDGYTIFTCRARDRFGDYGLIGVAIVGSAEADDRCELDTFLLSCRALGRGVETAFLHAVATALRDSGARELCAVYVEGPRNQPVSDFLTAVGFAPTVAGRYRLPLDSPPPAPTHVAIEPGIPLPPTSSY